MSFLVADALATRQIIGLGYDTQTAKEFPPLEFPTPGLKLFDGTDVVEFATANPGAIDVHSLPVRPPDEAIWIEAAHDPHVDYGDTQFQGTSYGPDDRLDGLFDRFGALVDVDEPDDNGYQWVTIRGFERMSPGANRRAAGQVARMPFTAGYLIDERGMLAGDRSTGEMLAGDRSTGEIPVSIKPLYLTETDGDIERNAAKAFADADAAEAKEAEHRAILADEPDPEVRAELEAKCDELRDCANRIRTAAVEMADLVGRDAEVTTDLADMYGLFRPLFELTVGRVLVIVAAMNVRNTVREPMRASRQVRRDRQRRGLIDPSEVTVLKVPGAQRRAAEAAGSGLPAGERPHHPVLGHFAYYGDSHPDGVPRGLLFGRQEGVFWHPPHWRGSREAGERSHTYRVVPPENP